MSQHMFWKYFYNVSEVESAHISGEMKHSNTLHCGYNLLFLSKNYEASFPSELMKM
jgi:hypothetical protein